MKVSVVITCYNLGKYLNDAINSVVRQTFQDFEIILVNDGSTDEETNQIIKDLDTSKLKVINTYNQGPSKARNTGILQAAGEYILPLDADDKISSTYLEKAIKVLDHNENVGIVYCKAEFFGERNFKWDLPEYSLPRILVDNLIFCCAFFRKKDWEKVKGYKSNMVLGWEDYDFWLSIIELKREVYQIPEYLFHYRIRKDSRSDSIKKGQTFQLYKQIYDNHQELYADNIEYVFEHIYSLRNTIQENEQHRIDKDTYIHNLNMEISKLNMESSKLNGEISHLNMQLADIRILVRKLFKSLKTKIKIFSWRSN